MRRIWQAAICTMVLWFGLFELGGFAVYEGGAAGEQEIVQASGAATTAAYYETKPVPAEQASYEPGKRLKLDKPVKAAAAPPKINQKLLYLTFDDGPSENTEKVLNILKQEGIMATFFVLGEHVLQKPEIAKRIVAEGHSIGNHTFNHKYEILYGSFADFSAQVMKTDDAIFRSTGVRTTLFRAPGGTYSNFDKGYFDAMAAAGYQVYDWNVDSGDSKRVGVPASEILTTVKGSKLADKLIVLLHDSAGHAESVKALPAIIKYYKSKGYAFAPITDQVEPIHFKVAKKLKWSRAQVSRPEKIKLVQFSEKLGRSIKPIQPAQVKKDMPDLILHRGQESLVFRAGEYSLSKGTIEVPLLKLTEWVEGKPESELDDGASKAYASGDRMLPGPSPAGKAADGKAEPAVAPVRATLKKFGIEITSYIYNDQQREIWVTE